MSEINVIGKVRFVGQTVDVSTTFQKRELVVTTDEQYPQHILINFTQGKCNLLDTVKIGDEVNVSINLRGREWVNPQGETKYFNDIQGWRVSYVTGAPQQVPVQQSSQQMPAAQQPVLPNNQSAANFVEDNDDLPF